MTYQRISVALPFARAVDPEEFIPVFHDWIRRGAVEGLLLDVARYAHVHHGPGIMLIGHEGDYSVDLAGGRPALKYTLKRDADGTARELVARSVRRLLGAAAEATPVAAPDTTALVVRIADRLRAPNTPETLAALGPEITAAVADAAPGVQVTLRVEDVDPRAPFGVVASASDPAALAAAVAASGAPVAAA